MTNLTRRHTTIPLYFTQSTAIEPATYAMSDRFWAFNPDPSIGYLAYEGTGAPDYARTREFSLDSGLTKRAIIRQVNAFAKTLKRDEILLTGFGSHLEQGLANVDDEWHPRFTFSYRDMVGNLYAIPTYCDRSSLTLLGEIDCDRIIPPNELDADRLITNNGREECDTCGKTVFMGSHACKGVPVTPAAFTRYRERIAKELIPA